MVGGESGGFDSTIEVMAKALTPGPHLLGQQISAADVAMGAAMRWGLPIKLLPERLGFLAYAGQLSERPALQRTMAQEAVPAPRQQLACSREPPIVSSMFLR